MSITIETNEMNNGFKIPFEETIVSSYLSEIGAWVMVMHYGRKTEWHYRLFFSSLN